MSSQAPTILTLEEYKPQSLARDAIPETVGRVLWHDFGPQVLVEFPTPATDDHWRFTAQGWVGYIPVVADFGVALRPKVPISNLFGMLEYAYRLKSFRFLEGQNTCATLEEFYERLAKVLSLRVLDRARKGLYRAYLAESEHLPFVRGRMDVMRVAREPWSVNPLCHYQDISADIEENQILAWTLLVIARGGICTERVLPAVRKAYRALQGLASATPFSSGACIKRLYNRLNDDYQPMHALCRFFLEHSGPSHECGDRVMLPFLVDMARLFELFVAEWLRAHVPLGLILKAQETVYVGQTKTVEFAIDLALYDASSGAVCCVLDTKYKKAAKPDPADIAQVVAYAAAKSCKQAVLIYPGALAEGIDETFGESGIRVRSLAFSLDDDIEAAGQALVKELCI